MGDTKKLLKILLIAAHLKRTDVDLWVKVATLAVDQQNLRIAVQCLNKGLVSCVCCIYCRVLNFEYVCYLQLLHWILRTAHCIGRKHLSLCEMKEHRKAIDTYEHLLKVFLSQTENVSETAPVISG